MADGALLKNKFNGGQVDLTAMGRGDLDKVQSAALAVRNMIPLPGGAVTRRPGVRRLTRDKMNRTVVKILAGDTSQPGGTTLYDVTSSDGQGLRLRPGSLGLTVARSWGFSPNASVSFVVSLCYDDYVLSNGNRPKVPWDSGTADFPTVIVVHSIDNPDISAGIYAWGPGFSSYRPGTSLMDFNPWEVQCDVLADTMVLTHRNGSPVRIRYTGASAVPGGTTHNFEVARLGDLYDAVAISGGTPIGVPPMEPFLPDAAKSAKPIRIDPDSETLTASVYLPSTYTQPAGSRIEITMDGQPLLGTVVTNTATTYGGQTVRLVTLSLVNRVVSTVSNDARMFLAPTWYDDSTTDNSRNELRSDKLVFGNHMEGAWVRWKDRYPDVRAASTFLVKNGSGVPAVRWAKVASWLGPVTMPLKYVERATADYTNDRFFTDHVYRIPKLPHLTTIPEFQTYAGGTLSAPDWTNSLTYNTRGAQFVWKAPARVKTTVSDPLSFIEDISAMVQMDALSVTDVYTEGDNLTVVPAGAARWTSENSLSRTAFLYVAPDDTARWTRKSYHMARFGTKWVFFCITDDAPVSQSDGSLRFTIRLFSGLPREATLAGEAVEQGVTSEYVSSLWSRFEYPSAVAFHEQRLFFAGSPSYPETIWASALGVLTDFRSQEPDGRVLSTTGMSVSIAGSRVSRIQWLLSGPSLLVGTDNSEWAMSGYENGGAMSATNVRLRQETAYGSYGSPIRVGSRVLFVAPSGRQVVEYGFSNDSASYEGRDLLLLSCESLLGSRTVVQLAACNNGVPLVYARLSDGSWLTLTYDPSNGVYAWAGHSFSFPTSYIGGSGYTYVRDMFSYRVNGGTTQRLVFLLSNSGGDGLTNSLFAHVPGPEFCSAPLAFDTGAMLDLCDVLNTYVAGTNSATSGWVRYNITAASSEEDFLAKVLSGATVPLSHRHGASAADGFCIHVVAPCGNTAAVATANEAAAWNRVNGGPVTGYSHRVYRRTGPGTFALADSRGPLTFPLTASVYVTAGWGFDSTVGFLPHANDLASTARSPQVRQRIRNLSLCLVSTGHVRVKQVPLSGAHYSLTDGGAQHSVDVDTTVASSTGYLPGDNSGRYFTGWLDVPFSGTADCNAMFEVRAHEPSGDGVTIPALPYPLTLCAVRVDTV